MKSKFVSSGVSAVALLSLFGCGASPEKPPTQAVLHQRTASPNPKVMTKEDKIAAINRAPMPEEQKKAEIKKVNAGQD